MLDCNIFPGLGQDYLATEVNMFLLPVQENDGEDNLTKAGYSSFVFTNGKNKLSSCMYYYMRICAMFRVGNIPPLLSATGLQRTPNILHHGFQTPQPNTGHAPLSAVAHHPHREELVNITFFSVHFPCISTGEGGTCKIYFYVYLYSKIKPLNPYICSGFSHYEDTLQIGSELYIMITIDEKLVCSYFLTILPSPTQNVNASERSG